VSDDSLSGLSDIDRDLHVVRQFLQREIETINAYQRMLVDVSSEDVKRMLAHAIYEEKEHVAEGMQLLRRLDPMQDQAMNEDHSDHFAEEGPGARALAALGANAALEKNVPSKQPAAGEVTARAVASPPGSPRAATTGRAYDVAELSRPTIGSLRGKSV
jgi:hypothetical protein